MITQKVYDAVLSFIGTWYSVLSILVTTCAFVLYGALAHAQHDYWDKLNLGLSVYAIFGAEFILMAGKRDSERITDILKRIEKLSNR